MERSSFDEQQSGASQDVSGVRQATRPTFQESFAKRRSEAARLAEAGRTFASQVQDQVQKRPLATVGTVAAVSFVAGSVLGSKLGQVCLAVGFGYALRNIADGAWTAKDAKAGLDELTGQADTF